MKGSFTSKDVAKTLGFEVPSEMTEDLELGDLLSDISLNFINYRLSHNLSQRDMAKLLEVSQPMISKIESGEYNFSVGQAFRLCRKLGLDFSVKIESKTVDQPYDYSTYAKFNPYSNAILPDFTQAKEMLPA